MSADGEVLILIEQQDHDVVYREGFQHQVADFAEQFVQVQHSGGLAGDSVDGFELPRATLFQRIEPGVFQRD